MFLRSTSAVTSFHRKDYHRPEDFAVPVPILPPNVRLCEGIPRAKWVDQLVTLQDECGVDVARGVIQNIDPEMIFDQNGRALGDDRVAIHIAESLVEDLFPSTNMWSICTWHIRNVILYNGSSLYDHDETHKYNMATNPKRPRKGVQAYETTRVRVDLESPPKKEVLLTMQSITSVSTKSCCAKSCVQYFPRALIQAVRTELYGSDDFKAWNKTLLEVHRQIHKDDGGKEWITLKERDVCPSAWWIIHEIGRSTFYRYKEKAKAGKEADVHGNWGLKKPRMETIQATVTLRHLIESDADKMPHKTRTIQTGEKVTAMVLPSSFCWSDQLKAINDTNASFNLRPISSIGLSNIRRNCFLEFAAKARGDTFARCGLCDRYKQLRNTCVGEEAKSKWSKCLAKHNARQLAHRELYYANRNRSKKNPEKMLCIIHNKMDHSKTASPHFSHKTKVTDAYMKMHVSVTGMIAHGHGDEQYAHYGLDIYPTDSNHTIGSIAKLLRDLEGVPKNSSRKLFSIEDNQSTLMKAVLNGAKTCLDSLLPPSDEPILCKPLPPVLILQLDNCSGDNKNRYVFGFCSMLVCKGIFREVYINFLIVEHTHEDIEALFGRWSSRLKTNDYPTLPRLMKSFMDCEEYPMIPHLIEEVPDFKTFVDGYLGTGGDFLEGQSRSQQFKFFVDSNGWPLMEYKNLCTDDKWLPEDGKGIRLWSETAGGLPKLPMGSPLPLIPRPMKACHDVKKGLNGFIAHWKRMGDDDYTKEFRRKHGTLEDYWKGVRMSLDAPLQVREALLDGFWPASRIAPDETDRMRRDGTLPEEDKEALPFVGRRRDRPPPSFNVKKDTHEEYFLAMRLADGDLKPFWLAQAITAPSPDPRHLDEIRIQYWTPSSNGHVDKDTYEGWDTKQGNSWRKDTQLNPTWSSTGCIPTAWKPRFQENTKKPKVSIPNLQIGIIKASLAAFTSDACNGVAYESMEED